MRRAHQGFILGYSQRIFVELSLVVIILGVLVTLAAEIMPIYTKSAKLVEPVYLVKDVQTHMLIDAALTGEWPGKSNIPIDLNNWESTVYDFDVNQFGNISVVLHDDLGFNDSNVLGFNLSVYGEGTAFRFYSWHCSDFVSGPSLHNVGPVKSTVPLIVSHTICRK